MFLTRIKNRESGLLLYGITPPKAKLTVDKVKEMAGRSLATLCSLEIDALVVYDVQDESARTAEERPFPFSSSLDPFEFSCQYLHELAVPKIIYRPLEPDQKHTKSGMMDFSPWSGRISVTTWCTLTWATTTSTMRETQTVSYHLPSKMKYRISSF